jgi:transcriptional regulator with XRE-family HTH domain
MRLRVTSVADLGLALRAARKGQRIRLDDLAATAGVSKQFASDVEHGKPTVQLGLVLKLLDELGLALLVDLPAEAEPALQALDAMRGPQARRAQE